MTAAFKGSANAAAGPSRDFVGYGRTPPRFLWPDGSYVAVNVVVNYEEGAEYSLPDGDRRNETWGEYSYTIDPQWRDFGTETHYEYGSRVGIWRIARLFDEFGIDATVGACAVALERNPEVCAWLRESNHDIIGHGHRWLEEYRHARDEEEANLRLAVESIERSTAQRIVGWYLRSFPTIHTRELLIRHGGFLYDSDACNDEIPYYVDVSGVPFLVVPYSKVHNDVKFLAAPSFSTPMDFFDSLRLALDFLVDEARQTGGGRMMTVGLHPRWIGQANRAPALKRFFGYAREKEGACFMRRSDIARFWLDRFPPARTPALPDRGVGV